MTHLEELDSVGPITRVTAADQDKARLTAARYAENAEELRMLLDMLGLTEPAKTASCESCARPFSNTGAEGTARRHAHRICGPCYATARRAAKA